ncbi:MAG: hypothetical protein JW952_06825 [Candidatus Eisenbacteria bacterium]|nr:hypothetical protein [Candidatus Eisenbacteria bacterium]
MKRVFLVAVLVMLALPGCNETDRVVDNGTIVFMQFEGGFFGIIDDHNRHWDPSNLPPEFQVDSLRVRFEGVVTDLATFHMWGRTIELTAIKRL